MAERPGSEQGRRGPRRRPPSEGEIRVDLGLGDLFKGLGNLFDMVNEMAGQGESESSRTGEIRGPGGVQGVYGFSVKVGLGGKPVIEPFGNIHSTDSGSQVSEVREPLVDVFDESDHVLVVVELPGVAEKNIRVEVKDDILSLSAEGGDRKYGKEVLLPALVDPSTLKQSYQNGILEIQLGKAGKSGS
ncbi:MAG: Hsp20/alpha crystallin family protein [Chloroflexi bacterium]|nr:Hsp20/alpha crystallin family protein [Chloroflexota bacterium]